MTKTNKELLEEILTVVKSLVDLLVVGKKLPSIDYDHERDIDHVFDRSITAEDNEDLQEVHDETKPEPELAIEWTIHDGKKYKPCKYKCGCQVNWNNDIKKYVHYNDVFDFVSNGCPKFGGS